MESIEQAGYQPGEEVNLCLDVAATEFYCKSIYKIQGKPNKAHTVAVATPCCPAPVSAIILDFHIFLANRICPIQLLIL